MQDVERSEWGHLIRLLTSPPSPQGEGLRGGLRFMSSLCLYTAGRLSFIEMWGLSSKEQVDRTGDH